MPLLRSQSDLTEALQFSLAGCGRNGLKTCPFMIVVTTSAIRGAHSDC